MKDTKFTFALITDTHIRPPQGDDSSPYAVNDLANDRARVACHMIASYNPEFTIHLGDMVHTLPHLPTYADACEEAHRIFEPLKPELHFVAGNHDIGDKPMAISPAGPVDAQSKKAYRHHFGEPCQVFEERGCVFISINSSLVNTKSKDELEQRNWLEAVLEEYCEKRLFVFSHYPPFINSIDEPAHYDNYEEPGRSWFLKLMTDYKVEAVFSGHVHQFFYNMVGSTKFYCLPPTSFTRQDYAELYRIGPTHEFGRNDTGKFNVTLVDIDELDHHLRIIPTEGRTTLGDNNPCNDSLQSTTPLVVHLRHAWYEAIDLPFNGPMEEFGRKRARNDYSLARLWQMGLFRVRTPLADIMESVSHQRMIEYAASGVRFTLFSLGKLPGEAVTDLVQHASMIDALELVVNDSDWTRIDDVIVSAASLGAIDLHLGKAHTSANEKIKGTKFAHNVSYGFLPTEIDSLMISMAKCTKRAKIKAIIFQINFFDDLKASLTNLRSRLNEHKFKLAANIRLAQISPANGNFDDQAIRRRVEQANAFACQHPDTTIHIDTFADIDRGYSPRNGLVDRHYNFRLAGRSLMEQQRDGFRT